MSSERSGDEASSGSDVTRLLSAAGAGDRAAADELFRRVYAELRAAAGARMSGERADHTLQATALVNEVWLRLTGEQAGLAFENRAHFHTAAAEAMRRILIEHARRRGREKRGGAAVRLPLSAADLAAQADSGDFLAVDEAIRRLEAQDTRMAEIVKLRFFAGLSEDEIAAALRISDRTVRREWTLARAWLARELAKGGVER
jgi:RNA polymerase sigma factor (TIGR02999 family)